MEESKQETFKSVNIDSVKYRTKLTNKFQKRKKYEPKDPKKVLAFIPGTVKTILIKENKKVKSGEKLLILEAMKMYNAILAPFDGTIKKIYTKEGVMVPKDKLLLEFE